MVTVYVGLQLKTDTYEAQVKVLISAEKQVESPFYRDLLGTRSQEVALTQSEIVKSNPVIERAVMAMKLYSRPLDYEKRFCSPIKAMLVDQGVKSFEERISKYNEQQKTAIMFRKAVETLKQNVEVEPVRDTNIFLIKARDFSPVGAAITANVVSRSYVIFDLEQQLAELQLKYGEKHLAVKQMKDNIEAMSKGLTGEPLSDIEAIGPASVKIVEQAQMPIEPIGPSKLLTAILAVIMAPFLGVMMAFVFEYMDQTFKSSVEMEKYLGIAFLGAIPKKGFVDRVLMTTIDGKSAYARAYRNISDQLYLIIKDKGLRSVLFASSLNSEGTTSVVANLGRYLSKRLGHKVLVIDANLRSPKIHKTFKIQNNKGFSNVLAGEAQFKDCLYDAGDNLAIIPAGTSKLNPMTLLDTPRMAAVMKEAREKFEMILIDSACLRDYQDSVVVSSYTDGVVLVVNESRTRRQVVKSALRHLQAKDAKMVGAILNNRAYVIPRVIYEWT